MSQLTNFLKLFKWNTSDEADLEEEFNIDKSMNDNWDKIDKFAKEAKDKLDGLSNYDDSEIKQDIADIKEANTSQDEEIVKLQEIVQKQGELLIKYKNNQFNETIEGTSINVQDSSDLPAVLEVSGGVRQATRKGTNLLDLNVTQNSKVTVNEDGTITINGTGGFSLNYKELTLKANITYYQKWELISGSATSTNGEIFMTLDSSKYSAKDKFTSFSKTEDTVRSSLWISESAIFTNAVIKIWANTDQSDFEKAGATPSPDYPSDVQAVGDNVNYFNKDTVTQNKYLSWQNQEVENSAWTYSDYIPCNPNEKWIISGYNTIGGAPAHCYYDKNKNFLSGGAHNNQASQMQFTTPNDCYYFRESIAKSDIDTVKIEQGKIATSYSPYGMGSLEINKVNKNFANIEEFTVNAGVGTTHGKTIENLKENTTYTLSFIKTRIEGVAITNTNIYGYKNIYYYNNETLISQETNSSATSGFSSGGKSFSKVITTPENCNKIIVYFDNTNGDSNFNTLVSNVQLELGEVATDYIPHQSELYNLVFQQPMLSGDTFVKEDGNWFEVHEWKKYVFTGDEEFIGAGSGIANVNYISSITDYAVSNDIICHSNYFKSVPNVTGASGIGSKEEDNIIAFINNHTNYRFYIKSSQYSNPTDLKDFLKEKYTSDNSVYMWYKLATPTKLPCTPEQIQVLEQLNNMPTYRPVTNVFTQEDLANLKLNYVADSKIYVDNKISMLAEQILNK